MGEKPVMVPAFIGVLCEVNVSPKLFASDTLDALYGGDFRREINRVVSAGADGNDFPAVVGALATKDGITLSYSDNPGELKGRLGREWLDAVMGHEKAGGNRDDEQSPCYDIYELNRNLEQGSCWRVYTSVNG